MHMVAKTGAICALQAMNASAFRNTSMPMKWPIFGIEATNRIPEYANVAQLMVKVLRCGLWPPKIRRSMEKSRNVH